MEDDRGRLQVLKLITDVADDAAALAALLDEVRQTIPPHPALQPITEVGVSEEGVYLASPVLNASTVEGRLRGGRQTLEATLPWLRVVTAGLHAAHEAGVCHGAIHPRDVLVTEEGGVLTGVGIAPALERLKLQAPVRVPFTAPERASGRSWDARADQYSLAMLALDALSGRRLIAGTIPAFDRWTLAETPTEDARLHEVFVRALHPDPAQRYPSVDAWCEALAGPEREAESGALSRFAREGVILAAPATQSDPPREIKVQAIEDPEGVALSLFPQEDGTIDSPVVESVAPDADTETPESAAEQEWLVADVPDESTTVEPEADPFVIRYAPDVPDPPTVSTASTAPAWHLDDDGTDVTTTTAAPPWDMPADDSGSRRTWLMLAVMLIMAALAYGTWSSLQGPASAPVGPSANGEPAEPSAGPAPAKEPAASGGPAASGAPSVPPPAKSVPQGPVTPTVRPNPRATDRQAASPAPAAAEPVAAAVGRVLIRSSPSGDVRVNGIARGETPVVLRDLPFGQYAVTVTRAGFTPVEREVSLLASQPVASLSVDLVPQRPGAGPPAPGSPPAPVDRPAPASPPATAPSAPVAPPASATPAPAPVAGPSGGIFVVSTPTPARLFVDGQPYGNTPASIPGLPQGAHVVRVEAPGYRPWEGRVAVVAGTRVRVVATLQQGQE